MAKKYIPRPGQKVTIEINRRGVQSPRGRARPSPKALIKTRREDDYQARRLLKNLRIFDGGRNKDGDDITGFLVQPAFPSPVPTTPDPSLANYAARDAFLFALEGETLFDKFYEIKRADAELYRLAFKSDAGEEILYETSEYWTDKGIKIPKEIAAGENFRFGVRYGTGLPDSRRYRLNFFGFKVFDSSYPSYKTTEVYDFEADVVTDFRLKAGDALFLMPLLCTYRCFATWFFGNQDSYLNYDIRLGLRSFYVDNLTPDVDPSDGSAQSIGTGVYANAYAAAQVHIGLPSARAWRIGDEVPYSPVPPAGFLPNPPFTPSSPTTSSSNWEIQVGILGDTTPPDGALLGVVKRGAKTFYLWKD